MAAADANTSNTARRSRVTERRAMRCLLARVRSKTHTTLIPYVLRTDEEFPGVFANVGSRHPGQLKQLCRAKNRGYGNVSADALSDRDISYKRRRKAGTCPTLL